MSVCTCLHVHTFVLVDVCLNECNTNHKVYKDTYIHCRYVCMYVRVYVLMHAHTHAHKHTHVRMYVRMYHTRSHVQTHTRMHTQTSHSSHVKSGAGLCPFRGTTKLSPVWSRNWGEEEENRASGNVRMNKHHKLTVCVSTYVYTYI